MNLNNIVFLDSYPKLDLHGYDRDSARVAINDFIRDNKKQKKEILVIVHGIGSGVIKETTAATLKNNKDVVEYKTFYYNHGCTVVKINIQN
ncbi:MAG: Smr/MutS family protein [Bacilli bacterium]|nr:Smr/MutS family protein [Bacilli bacterium]MDD4608087.1 Smr/MutS family protein [Bacilli bacterium]